MSRITRQAEVVRCHAGQIDVRTCEPSGCETCSLAHGCGQVFQVRWLRRSPALLTLVTDQQLQPGDRVLIGLDAASFHRAVLLQFVLPLAGLLLAAILAESLMLSLGWTALMALTGLLAGLWLARWLGKGFKLHLLHRLDSEIDLASD